MQDRFYQEQTILYHINTCPTDRVFSFNSPPHLGFYGFFTTLFQYMARLVERKSLLSYPLVRRVIRQFWSLIGQGDLFAPRAENHARSFNINRAARRPISTAKFVPRSHGYTWLMLAKYSPESGVRISGMCREWLTSGMGWA